MQTLSSTPKSRRGPIVLLAVFLQASPLLTVAGCTDMGVSNGSTYHLTTFTGVVGGFGILFAWMVWGLGYAYLREWKRFAISFILGPVFVLTSCTASFNGVNYDFEHGRGDLLSARHAALQQAIVIGIVTVLILVDTWRLAARKRAESL